MNPSAAPKRTLWPYAIVATFVFFAGYIGYLVQQAMRSGTELVSADYYQQELRHQQRMESEARTAALPAPVQLRHEAAARRLTVQLPAALAGQKVRGYIRFFRPSNQQLDFSVPLLPDATLRQQLSTGQLQPGYWRVRLDFTAGTQAYFVEEKIRVEP